MGMLKFQKMDNFVEVSNKRNDILGNIEFYDPWNRYVFIPQTTIVLSYGCMQEIVDYMKDELKSKP